MTAFATGRRTILLADNDPESLSQMSGVLRSGGFTVLDVRDAHGALALARGGMPNLIIQDLTLPDTAGLAFVHAIRALPGGAGVPIVGVAASPAQLWEARRPDGGYDGCLAKPAVPAELLAVAHSLARAGTPTAAGEGRRVLVVDDNVHQRRRLELYLREWGFRSVLAKSAAHGLLVARSCACVAVVCDVLMPGTDGFGLCRLMRQEPALKQLPFILISAARPEESDLQAARLAGATALLMGTPEFWGLRQALESSLAG